MASATEVRSSSEYAILARVIDNASGVLSIDAAKAFLAIEFASHDRDRVRLLGEKSNDGRLSPEEIVEMESYRRIGFLLDLIHSKARRSLQSHRVGP